MNDHDLPSFDALLPAEMARKAAQVGVAKATLETPQLFALAVLAGAFIALGAIFATTVSAGSAAVPFGLAKLASGLVFCLGLILVVVAGAELFTGNNLIIIAWASGRISTTQLLRNWGIVYAGNTVGALATAVLMLLSRQYTFGAGLVGLSALNSAQAKVELGFGQAIVLGIFCNALVCLAVWLCLSARTLTDKILATLFPITAFVTAGFEHSIANLYFVPLGLLIKGYASADFWADIGRTASDYATLTWGRFLFNNLLPVTLGNIIGGTLMVGLIYWFIYLRPPRSGETNGR